MSRDSHPVATINLMTVITAMEMAEVERRFVAPLLAAARQISETLSESVPGESTRR